MTIKEYILGYLMCKDWVAGGDIEDFIRITGGSKASCVSRRCRELADEGKIERRIVSAVIKDKTLKFVQYRIKPLRNIVAEFQALKRPKQEFKQRKLI